MNYELEIAKNNVKMNLLTEKEFLAAVEIQKNCREKDIHLPLSQIIIQKYILGADAREQYLQSLVQQFEIPAIRKYIDPYGMELSEAWEKALQETLEKADIDKINRAESLQDDFKKLELFLSLQHILFLQSPSHGTQWPKDYYCGKKWGVDLSSFCKRKRKREFLPPNSKISRLSARVVSMEEIERAMMVQKEIARSHLEIPIVHVLIAKYEIDPYLLHALILAQLDWQEGMIESWLGGMLLQRIPDDPSYREPLQNAQKYCRSFLEFQFRWAWLSFTPQEELQLMDYFAQDLSDDILEESKSVQEQLLAKDFEISFLRVLFFRKALSPLKMMEGIMSVLYKVPLEQLTHIIRQIEESTCREIDFTEEIGNEKVKTPEKVFVKNADPRFPLSTTRAISKEHLKKKGIPSKGASRRIARTNEPLVSKPSKRKKKPHKKWVPHWASSGNWIVKERIHESTRRNIPTPVPLLDLLSNKQSLSETQKAAIWVSWKNQERDSGLAWRELEREIASMSEADQEERHVQKTSDFSESRKKSALDTADYKIISRMGEDMTGITYKGQSQVDGKMVIIKSINPETLADKKFMAKLEEWVERSSNADIPNTRKIYGILKSEEITCIVSEFIEGKSLHKILQRKTKISIEKALQITLRLAKILKYASEKGIVHGDICPSNVLISSTGKVILANLGIPTKVARNARTIAQIDGIAPLYMAPEVLAEKQSPDRRSDIYSLGALFYHLLAKRPPIEGNSPFEVLNRLMERTPIPPIHLYNLEVPNEICHIIEKMMAPEIEERYRDYSELIADLQNPRSAGHRETEEEGKEEAIEVAPQYPLPGKRLDTTEEIRKEEKSLQELTDEKISSLSTVSWGKWMLAASFLLLVGWRAFVHMEKERILQEAEKEWYGLRKYYRENHQDKDKWDKIEKKFQEYLAKYREVEFPNYEIDRSIKKDVEEIAHKFKRHKEKRVASELNQEIQRASHLAREYKFRAALEALDTLGGDFKSGRGSQQIQGARDGILKMARQRIDQASVLYKEALQSKRFEKALGEIGKLAENFDKEAKSPGEFAEEIAKIRHDWESLKKEESMATKQKEEQEKEKFEEAYRSLQKQIQQSSLIYDYKSVARTVERFKWPASKEKGLLEEYNQKIAEIRKRAPFLRMAKDVLIERLQAEINNRRNLRLFYKNKAMAITRINDREFTLEGNNAILWKDFPKDKYMKLVKFIENKVNPQEKLSLSHFALEHEEYTLGYELLSQIAQDSPEAKEMIAGLENVLRQKVEEQIELCTKAIENSDYAQALKAALLARKKYLLPGPSEEKYDALLGESFLRILNRSYHEGSPKYRFFDFSSPAQSAFLEYASSAKFKIEKGRLEIERGSISLDPKDLKLFAGMCRLYHKEQKIAVYLLNDKRRLYSLQISGEGRASYGAYHIRGGAKNESEFKEVHEGWLSFALLLSSDRIEWYIDGQNRFSSVHVDGFSINKIQIHAYGGNLPVSIDNLYVGFRK